MKQWYICDIIFMEKKLFCHLANNSYLCFLKNTKIMNPDIHIKQGYGDIYFEMPVEEVVAKLGEPNEVENIDNATDETTTVLRYANRFTLFFEGDTPTLSCIDIIDEKSTLFGQNIFEMGEKEIVRLMVDNNYYEQDIDNEAWGERRVSFGEGNIDFYFEDDVLLSVIIGR